METEKTESARTEVWVSLAYALFFCAACVLVYLGSRPAGTGPVFTWWFGPVVIAGAAVLVASIGVIWSARNRPFWTRPRIYGWIALALVIGGITFPFPFPSCHDGHPSSVRFHLPVHGEWTVVWGGEETQGNLLARVRADRRWGLDLLITRDGASLSGSGDALEHYFAFDQPVFAPAAGRVVSAQGNLPDRAPGTREKPPEEEFGNYLVLEVAPEEFVFLCNLRQGSLLVKGGDAVASGQELARVGNSGASRFTPEPHLALHLQDTPTPRWGQAIPWRFHDYASGGARVESGLPRGGMEEGPRFVGERVESFAP
jgi:peptidase M23-like protein